MGHNTVHSRICLAVRSISVSFLVDLFLTLIDVGVMFVQKTCCVWNSPITIQPLNPLTYSLFPLFKGESNFTTISKIPSPNPPNYSMVLTATLTFLVPVDIHYIHGTAKKTILKSGLINGLYLYSSKQIAAKTNE